MARTKRVKGATTATDTWREKILAEALAHVAFDGWHDKTLKEAAAKIGASDAELKAAFPRGVADALLFFSSEADRQAAEAIEAADLKPMRVRERVTFAVRQRIEAVMKHKEAARRGAAVFALPQHAIDGDDGGLPHGGRALARRRRHVRRLQLLYQTAAALGRLHHDDALLVRRQQRRRGQTPGNSSTAASPT